MQVVWLVSFLSAPDASSDSWILRVVTVFTMNSSDVPSAKRHPLKYSSIAGCNEGCKPVDSCKHVLPTCHTLVSLSAVKRMSCIFPEFNRI